MTIAAAVVLALVAVPAAVAQHRPCTQDGTPQRDVMHGGNGSDVLCGNRGDDFLHGGAGNDLLRAGRNDDTAVGAEDNDTISGGRGRDRLFGADNDPDDVVRGGPGTDQCFADEGDAVRDCESVSRGFNAALVFALYDLLEERG